MLLRPNTSSTSLITGETATLSLSFSTRPLYTRLVHKFTTMANWNRMPTARMENPRYLCFLGSEGRPSCKNGQASRRETFICNVVLVNKKHNAKSFLPTKFQRATHAKKYLTLDHVSLFNQRGLFVPTIIYTNSSMRMLPRYVIQKLRLNSSEKKTSNIRIIRWWRITQSKLNNPTRSRKNSQQTSTISAMLNLLQLYI